MTLVGWGLMWGQTGGREWVQGSPKEEWDCERCSLVGHEWEGGVVMEVEGAVECRWGTKGCLVWLLHAPTHTTLS